MDLRKFILELFLSDVRLLIPVHTTQGLEETMEVI